MSSRFRYLRRRMSNARDHTRGFLALRREGVAVLMVVPLTFAILKRISSESAARDEILAIAAASAITLIAMPVIEFAWNFVVAPYRLVIEDLEARSYGVTYEAKLKVSAEDKDMPPSYAGIYRFDIENHGSIATHGIRALVRKITPDDQNEIYPFLLGAVDGINPGDVASLRLCEIVGGTKPATDGEKWTNVQIYHVGENLMSIINEIEEEVRVDVRITSLATAPVDETFGVLIKEDGTVRIRHIKEIPDSSLRSE